MSRTSQSVLTDIRELKGRILKTLNAVITRHALSLSEIFNLLKDYERGAVTRALEELVEDGHIVVEYTSGYEEGVRTTDLGRRMKRLKVNQEFWRFLNTEYEIELRSIYELPLLHPKSVPSQLIGPSY